MRELVIWTPERPAPIDRRGLGVAEIITEARRHRLVGVLAAVVAADDIETRDDEVDAVARELTDAMAEALMLEDVMLDAIAVLDRHGVDYRVLKGSALAHTVHPDPSHRSWGDVDLLVRSSQIDQAVNVLTGAGGQRPVPPLSHDFDRRFAKSVTLHWRRRTELDLHRTLAPGPFGVRIELEDLWGEPSLFDLGGAALKTLSTELHLLNGAYHVALGDTEPRYGNLRDIVLMLDSEVDMGVVIDTAKRWRGEAVVAEAARLMAEIGRSVGEMGDWVVGTDVSARDRRNLDTYRRRRFRFRRQALAVLLELPWRDRLAYTRAVALPARSNLAARGRRLVL